MSDRVRVVVYLDRAALEDLELLVGYRHGVSSRSEVVRQAVMWLRAKEAAWLLRARSYERHQAARLAEDERARKLSREERERVDEQAAIAEAVRLAGPQKR